MGIEIHQIHNVVRTYQHALQPPGPAYPTESVRRQDDRVSFSPEARERRDTESAFPEHDRDNKKGTR
jgi:hypothetical protein